MAASEQRSFDATIPAGTLIASPHTVSLSMPPRVVRAIRWRVPPGPLGVMGFAITINGLNVVPYGSGSWIVANDESDRIELTDAPTSGAWQLTGYNTGTYDHTVYLDFEVEVVPEQAAPALSPIPVGSLSGSVAGGS